MNVHSLEWKGPSPSPQYSCASAMRERRAFVIGVDFSAHVGDLLIFPEFFAQYPVLRFATEAEESRVKQVISFQPHAFCVCAEPPEEHMESAAEGVGNLLEVEAQ